MSSNKEKDEDQGKDKDSRGTSDLGFATIAEEKQHEDASKGGRIAHETRTEEILEAGRKGGQTEGGGQSENEDDSSSHSRGKASS
ncbi:hypothetical protein [Nitrosomonas communis]|uniref:Stress-induced acidophilic repeat motif-containing protein n=1 Tax=Nitrosomonas communis TaxID=44574 RepID=A0A1I4NMM6_9PROT|nr:hypothetical protein [Nitrosomonas communis]SFM16758.1 hypothetical protein SAMN05421863_101575 [Nitrosomonas communis]